MKIFESVFGSLCTQEQLCFWCSRHAMKSEKPPRFDTFHSVGYFMIKLPSPFESNHGLPSSCLQSSLHAGAGRVKSGIMACSGLKRWIKIALTSSTCQNYVVCSNSWQFRRWTLSLTAHTACRYAFADCLTAHHQDSGITARSSFCSGSSCSKLGTS